MPATATRRLSDCVVQVVGLWAEALELAKRIEDGVGPDAEHRDRFLGLTLWSLQKLEESLHISVKLVPERYELGVRIFGAGFATGDEAARAQLDEVFFNLQLKVIVPLRLARVDKIEFDCMSLLQYSEDLRVEALGALDALARRTEYFKAVEEPPRHHNDVSMAISRKDSNTQLMENSVISPKWLNKSEISTLGSGNISPTSVFTTLSSAPWSSHVAPVEPPPHRPLPPTPVSSQKSAHARQQARPRANSRTSFSARSAKSARSQASHSSDYQERWRHNSDRFSSIFEAVAPTRSTSPQLPPVRQTTGTFMSLDSDSSDSDREKKPPRSLRLKTSGLQPPSRGASPNSMRSSSSRSTSACSPRSARPRQRLGSITAESEDEHSFSEQAAARPDLDHLNGKLPLLTSEEDAVPDLPERLHGSVEHRTYGRRVVSPPPVPPIPSNYVSTTVRDAPLRQDDRNLSSHVQGVLRHDRASPSPDDDLARRVNPAEGDSHHIDRWHGNGPDVPRHGKGHRTSGNRRDPPTPTGETTPELPSRVRRSPVLTNEGRGLAINVTADDSQGTLNNGYRGYTDQSTVTAKKIVEQLFDTYDDYRLPPFSTEYSLLDYAEEHRNPQSQSQARDADASHLQHTDEGSSGSHDVSRQSVSQIGDSSSQRAAGSEGTRAKEGHIMQSPPVRPAVVQTADTSVQTDDLEALQYETNTSGVSAAASKDDEERRSRSRAQSGRDDEPFNGLSPALSQEERPRSKSRARFWPMRNQDIGRVVKASVRLASGAAGADQPADTSTTTDTGSQENGGGGELYLPSEKNGFLGFCKGAWKLQTDQRKAFRIETRPCGMYSHIEYWRCTKCDFEGAVNNPENFRHLVRAAALATEEQTPPPLEPRYTRTIPNNSKLRHHFDQTIYAHPCGIRYRWAFLAKSHVYKRGDRWKGAVAKEAFACIFCCIANKAVPPVFDDLDEFIRHIRRHDGSVAGGHVEPPDAQALAYTKTIMGRVASYEEEFDLNIAPRPRKGSKASRQSADGDWSIRSWRAGSKTSSVHS
ncbi:hypothetical protein KEM52_001653 [Ascosphaera acerosa]|nr:hypothetical protein KEM52_001653 [Ascosphaera acerosa]